MERQTQVLLRWVTVGCFRVPGQEKTPGGKGRGHFASARASAEPFLNARWVQLMYWAGQNVCLVFRKIKDTFFIFTNNFIDLGILSMSAISCVVECWLFSINVSI